LQGEFKIERGFAG
jgi:sorting nexin-1/2